MKTTDLIDMMVQDDPAELPQQRPLALWVTVLVVLSAAIVLLVGGLRADFANVIVQPLVQAKYLLPLMVAVPSLWFASQARQPETTLKGSLLWMAIPAVIVIALLISTLANLPADKWAATVQGQSLFVCLASIPLLASPILAGLLWVMKQGATTRPALAGALAGLASGGLSASVYALHCFEDSPAFYGVWYSAGIVLMGIAGQLIGSRVLKW